MAGLDADPLAAEGGRLKVLFAAPNCLLDPSSGASLTCRTILERLAARGHGAMALGGTVFARPVFRTAETFLKRARARRAPIGEVDAWRVDHAGVRHILLPVRAQTRDAMTCAEEDLFYRVLKHQCRTARPDVVLTYGGMVSDLAVYRTLRDFGVPTVFYLANPNYHGPDPFRDVAAVITDSDATAALYKARLGLEATPVGKFVRAFPPAESDPRDYVTFLNPAPAKGVAMFAAIALECARRGLDAKFLVVESRARLAPVLERMGVDMARLPNVTRLPIQIDMAEVWRRTRILLHPSFWHESGSRSVLEALSAHVPSLATRSGGVAQMMGDSGFLFPNPFDGRDARDPDFLKLPPPEAVAPWVDRLERLLGDEAAYGRERARARAVWETHPHRDDIARVERIFAALAARPAAPGLAGAPGPG